MTTPRYERKPDATREAYHSLMLIALVREQFINKYSLFRSLKEWPFSLYTNNAIPPGPRNNCPNVLAEYLP
jgi:hypothetical protein